MEVLLPGEKLIAKKKDYNSGSIGFFNSRVIDAYDLYLAEESNGNFILVLFMKIQFQFKDSDNNEWTTSEKKTFEADFKRVINKKWGSKKIIKNLSNGKMVSIDFRFDTWIGGWSIREHWEVSVTKINKGTWKGSSVNPILKNVNLDSEDLNLAYKGNNESQRGIVHEFGHMLGLPDEYKVGTPHASDYSSIMNSGESVLKRHEGVYMDWLDGVLKKKGIS